MADLSTSFSGAFLFLNGLSMQQIKWHEASMIFPMLDDDKLSELADDIKTNGQTNPILIASGKVIDGRNRWTACKLAGVKPKTEEIPEPDDPVAFVLSLNLHRRHLTPSQASMCAARARDIYEKQAKERQGHGETAPGKTLPANLPEAIKGDARDMAGKAFGVSGKSVDHAKRVIEKGIPELAKAVDTGRMAVSTAAILATEPPEVQKAEVERPQRNRTYTPSQGGGKECKKPNLDPIHKHMETKDFAFSKAEVAITQLKGIPKKNKFREQAFEMVSNWILTKGN
jgi:hypothetical protein